MSLDCQMNKDVYIQWHIAQPSKKKKKILPLAMTWMELEYIMLSEKSQSEKEKYTISLICVI